MLRRLPLVAVAICLSLAVVSASPDVTFVLKSGQRESGALTFHVGSGDLGVTANGRERMFPFEDIALIQFASGDPSRDELNQLPTSGNPPESERHMLVLRNGQVIHGKYHGFTSDQMTFDVWGSGGVDRRTYNLGDVARLYTSAPGARSVYSSILSGAGDERTRGGRRWQGEPTEIRVQGNQPWTDTGLLVDVRQRLRFTASGEIQIGPNVPAGPDGNRGLAQRRTYPVREIAAGGLIGRVGNSAPFAIGSNSNPIDMPASGRLYLGINDDRFTDNSAWFTVKIER